MSARWGSRGFLGLSSGWNEVEPTAEYDWPHWTDGARWEIRHGEDYEVPTVEMKAIVEAKGEELKREVQVWMLGEDEPQKLRFLFELDRLSRAIKSGGDNVGW